MDRRGEIPPDPLQQRLGVVLHDVELHSPRLVGGAACGSASITVKVFKADLDVDSNNDGQIAADDDVIESNAPGKILACNNDFDNGDGNNPDCNVVTGPVSSEDDLVRVHLAIVGGPPNQGKWSLSCSPSNVRVWSQRTKDVNVPLNTWKDISEMPSTVYLEGVGVSAQAGGTQLTLSYDPRGGTLPMGSDTVRLTVATVEFTAVTLPNGFLGTLDDDPGRADYDLGIRQEALNTIKIEYRLRPEMTYSCQSTSLWLRYHGRMWWSVGQPPIEDAEGYLQGQGSLPGARADANEVGYPELNIAPIYDGICSSQTGGHYSLILESSRTGIKFTSDPCVVTAKPLVQGFVPTTPEFCPYTTVNSCPTDTEYHPNADEVYWGLKFRYLLNADLVGWDFEGTIDAVLMGDSTGLEIEVAGKTLRVARDHKMKSDGNYRCAKWEGFDSDIDEPGAEPYFWGPHHPDRIDPNNVYDYPQSLNGRTFWNVVPDHVVPETSSSAPYRVELRATADVDWVSCPACVQIYRRWGIPVRVKYNMTAIND